MAGRVRTGRAAVDHGEGVQDHLDALARARMTYNREWHPILAAVETEPGTWLMVAQFGEVYGIVRLIEVGGERGYRVTTAAERRRDRRLVGYYTTLRGAAKAAHQRWVRQHGPNGGMNGQT